MHTQSTPRACLLHDGKTRLLLSSQREDIRFNRTFFSASCTSTYASQAGKALMKSGDAPTKLGFLTSLRSLGLVGWNFFFSQSKRRGRVEMVRAFSYLGRNSRGKMKQHTASRFASPRACSFSVAGTRNPSREAPFLATCLLAIA